MPVRWPKQRRLVAHLRDILRREFGCQDAWVVFSGGRCRLEVRVDARRVTLLDDAEDAFWGRFYEEVQRERLHLGERMLEKEAWRRRPADLIAILTPYWVDRVGPAGLCAVALAAGEGLRLRPLTAMVPKALCPVGNVPLFAAMVAGAVNASSRASLR